MCGQFDERVDECSDCGDEACSCHLVCPKCNGWIDQCCCREEVLDINQEVNNVEYVSMPYDLGPPFFMDLDRRVYLLNLFHVESLGSWSESKMSYKKSVVRIQLCKLVKVV